jgi:hypothetical protein
MSFYFYKIEGFPSIPFIYKRFSMRQSNILILGHIKLYYTTYKITALFTTISLFNKFIRLKYS